MPIPKVQACPQNNSHVLFPRVCVNARSGNKSSFDAPFSLLYAVSVVVRKSRKRFTTQNKPNPIDKNSNKRIMQNTLTH